MEEKEITVEVDLSFDELKRVLEDNNFKLIDNFSIYNIYLDKDNKYNLINNTLVLRKEINKEGTFSSFINKRKEYKNNVIISSNKTEELIDNYDEYLEKLLNEGYNEIIRFNSNNYLYSNNICEMFIQIIDSHIYIEMESKCYSFKKEFTSIDELIKEFNKYNIPIKDNNYFVNKALNKMIDDQMYEYDGRFVSIMLCSTCNIKCRHCYIKYKGDFKFEEAKSLISKLKEKYIVMLNGTEPILNKDYFPLFKLCNQHKIMTNGLEIINNPSIIDELLKYDINEIGLSYHFGIHDKISITKTEDLNRLIKLLNEKNIKVKLMTSLTKDNYKNISNICREAYNLGAHYIKFTNLVNQGNATELKNKTLNKNEIDFVLKTIDEERKKYTKEELTIKRCGSFGPNKNKNNFECLACKNMAIITPELKVYRCIFDIDKGNEIGFVYNNRIYIFNKFKKEDTSYCEILKKYNNIQ